MKKWNQLLVRHGWMLKEDGENVFFTHLETQQNLDFLIECLEKVNVSFSFEKGRLFIHDTPVTEVEWISAIDFRFRGRGEGLWFKPGIEDAKVRELDTHIAGIVRQLNRIGFNTTGSCDGHGRRAAYVMIQKGANIEQATQLLLALGVKRVHFREYTNHHHINLPLSGTELLDLAEKMSLVEQNWLHGGYESIKEQMFYRLIEELLAIPGVSGNEAAVREFVKVKMTPFVDYITTDRYGNLLAEKTYRSGHGPTILLNAHLDLAYELVEGRKIVKENGIWSSSEGILGADDRAGVAVLIHMAEHLFLRSNFSGKVKFIFTVKEECGLVGARNVDEYFLWNTDAAIVVDRRGSSDIVVSCGGYISFCDELYGGFMEETAHSAGLTMWKCTNGGSSDTRVWAEHGIQSVNLSAGYKNEHTEDEYLDVSACHEVAKLIKEVFSKANELRTVLRSIKRKERVAVIMGDSER